MASNLRPDDPCAGYPIPRLNRPKGYPSGISNLRPPGLEDCEERGPPTLFLSDWDPHPTQPIGEVDPVGIRPDAQCAVMEWTGSEWVKISELTFGGVLGRTGDQWESVRSFVRFGNQGWICTASGALIRSTDGCRTWEVNYDPGWNTSDKTFYIDKDASGRLWSVQPTFSDPDADFGVFLNNDGSGDNWDFVSSIPGFGYMSDGAFWGPAHAISCHPTNPNVVIVAFTSNAIEPEGFSARYLYVTTDGGASWSTVKLPGQFDDGIGDAAAEGFFAAGDQGFDANGKFHVVWEVEEYSDPFALGPNNMHHIYVASSEDYITFSLVDVTPYTATHFGFLQQLYIYGDILHVAWTQDFDGDPAEGFDSFDGLASFVVRSNDGGATWSQPLRAWLQPIDDLIDMPGYPQDLFYDPDGDVIWVFFSMFDDAVTDGALASLTEAKEYLQNKVPGGSAHAEIAAISGLPIPRSKYGSVTRPWPPI